jgi:general stress protein 26
MAESKEEVRKRVLRFLREQKTAVIATVSPSGEPQAATISYLIDEHFNFYFIARKSSRKYVNLSHNRSVGLVIGTDPKIPAMAEIQGTAHVVETPDASTVGYFAKAMASDSSEYWPLFKSRGMDYVFFRVEITWLRWLDLATSTDFQTLEGSFYQVTN